MNVLIYFEQLQKTVSQKKFIFTSPSNRRFVVTAFVDLRFRTDMPYENVMSDQIFISADYNPIPSFLLPDPASPDTTGDVCSGSQFADRKLNKSLHLSPRNRRLLEKTILSADAQEADCDGKLKQNFSQFSQEIPTTNDLGVRPPAYLQM